jgi:hypothetical protein
MYDVPATVEDHLTFQAQQRGIPSRLIVAEVQRVVCVFACMSVCWLLVLLLVVLCCVV